jgi:CheY-like chemotaxis protein
LQLSEHVRSFESMLSSSLGNAISLSINIRPSTWQVRVDAGELELALVNLVLNARDAMPGGGTVSLLAENVTLDKSETPAGLSGEFVAIRVSDTGTGIAEDILEKVFDPFFTTKELGKGTGLGLSQVHGFVHQSGGTVAISSELGKGTMVTLYLPRCEDATEQVSTPKQIETVAGGKVLVVDDNPEVADVTAHMLRDLGYEVRTALNPALALDQVAASPLDLVVTDMVMPGPLNGLALARRIRQSKPQLPVLLVTGYAEAASQAGQEYPILRKPFDLADLSRVAERLIAESRQPATSNLVRLRPAPLR